MDRAAEAGDTIAVSSISLAEVVYLIEKGRLEPSIYDDLRAALADGEYVIEEVPLNGEIVDAMRRISRVEVPDLPDRVVAATGIYFGAPVVTRDGRNRASNVQTIW